MEQRLAPRAQPMGEVGVRVTGEQHALEEHQAGRPDRRRAAEPRQDLHGDDRLNQEQQEGGEEDRRRVRQARQSREADYLSMDFRVLPISAGLRVTLMPHSSMTTSFSCAVPLPPETMAPAWPMRFPAGAVMPAMQPPIGSSTVSFAPRPAVSSSEPPISPTMITASVRGSSLNMMRKST